MSLKVPVGWRDVKLGDLLPPEAFPELEKLAKQKPPPEIGVLKDFCDKYRATLRAKEVEADYLAWVLYAMFTGAI